MGRKTVLVDDYDGAELPEDTAPVHLSFGRTAYSLYLSEDNYGKLLEVLNPFIEGAETTGSTASTSAPKKASSGRPSVDTYGYDFNEVKTWAIANGQKAKSGKPITEDTRVLHQGIYDAFKKEKGD